MSAPLTFFAERGQVYMSDGPWSARLDQAQTDVLLDLWDAVGAVTAFNSLYEAVKAAGYLPPVITSKPLLRLVSDNCAPTPQAEVRQMLQASIESLRAAQGAEQ